MKYIVVINGYSGSGKDLFVEYCKYHIKNMVFDPKRELNVHNYSTIDCVKYLLEKNISLGRNENSRKLLSGLKDLLIEYNDYPLQKLVDYMANLDYNKDHLVFVHCREPEEIDKIVNLAYSVTTIFIERDIDKYKLELDKNIEDYHYMTVISNNGTKGALFDKAEEFCNNILGS